MMNYDEAIEALKELGATPVPFVCNEDGDKDYHHLRDDKSNEYQTVLDRITQPTLDDAIKVVEEMRNNAIRSSYYDKILITVLTAIKGLKEGKGK